MRFWLDELTDLLPWTDSGCSVVVQIAEATEKWLTVYILEYWKMTYTVSKQYAKVSSVTWFSSIGSPSIPQKPLLIW